ncbi:hypothetical protein P3S67_001784 [Capsicum chacoense]
MANLPEELITEIFVETSYKIPLEIQNHLLLYTTNNDYNHHGILLKFASKNEHGDKDCSLRDVLYHPETGALVDLDYPGKNRHDHPFLVGSVNGLVCLAFSLYDLFIWNPSIIKHMKLRNYELNLIMIYSWESESPGNFKFGFGYDELQDDYKIEKPCNFKEYHHLVLGVLGSDHSVLCNNTWRHTDVWVMKEYGVKESWTKMLAIKKSPVGFRSHVRGPPILMSNEGEFLLQFGSHLGKYNPMDDSIRCLDVICFASYFEAELYVKSLVCPLLN